MTMDGDGKMPDWNSYYPHKNNEGYSDPTAYHALESRPKKGSPEETRLKRMVFALKTVAELGGYEITNRIELLDTKTGKVYR